MQEKIQELMPDIKRNFFANTLKNYITNKLEHDASQRFVISDLRFIHEYEMLFSIPNIQKDDIAIIRVIRPNTGGAGAGASHKSEQEYTNIPYDIILFNNGTIDAYIEKFEKIMGV
jgi:hypothetical protein